VTSVTVFTAVLGNVFQEWELLWDSRGHILLAGWRPSHTYSSDCHLKTLVIVWIWVLCYDRQSVCLGIKHPSVAYEQIFITVGQLRVCWCGALSLMRGRVCRLQLLALASAVILWSEPLWTRDHILLLQLTLGRHPRHGLHRKHRFQQLLHCVLHSH
jgi:hypothetical protein